MSDETKTREDELSTAMAIQELNYLYDSLERIEKSENEIPKEVVNFDWQAVLVLFVGILGDEYFFSQQSLQKIDFAFAFMFLWLGIRGFVTVYSLARLRLGFFEILKGLAHINSFVVGMTMSRDAFKWRQIETLPRKFSNKSVSFFSVIQVSIISGVAMGFALFLFLSGLGIYNQVLLAVLLGSLVFVSYIYLYKKMLLDD